MTIRTRFAPSPTGYLHIGGARTALFSWLYARKHGGTFILRIEDTDLERSTAESVDAILQGMTWLGLEYDEGPFFQTHRFPRYKEVLDRMLEEGTAYHCYCSKERLETLRNEQMARKEKPRYDGKCRHGVPESAERYSAGGAIQESAGWCGGGRGPDPRQGGVSKQRAGRSHHRTLRRHADL